LHDSVEEIGGISAGALTREVQQGLTIPSLPVAYLLSDVLGTLSPDPWDFPLWARGRIRGKGDVI
jgi:hypothetical protein